MTDPHLPVVRLAGYEILEPIARGGMGVVFKARQVALDRTVALKVMIAGEHGTTETLERFRLEAKAAARLDHPNIVPIYDVGQEGPTHFFTMQLIDGESLASILQRGPIPPRRAMEIAASIARALEYAHAQGILHRDVKPGNILIETTGKPLLADFGLARDVSGGALTAPGSFIGTIHYASPEQIEADGSRIGPRTDVYSLGATLYETLTGRAPFSGRHPLEVVSRVLDGNPTPPCALSADVDLGMQAICLKAMEREPGHRYASAGALACDLERYLAGDPIDAGRSGTWSRRWRWAGRRRGAVAAIAASVVIVAGGVAALAWQAERRAVAEAGRAEDAARMHREGALEARQRAEREGAIRAAEAAEATVAKAERVSAVLARSRQLAPSFARMEATHYDSRPVRNGSGGPSESPLEQVREFVEATPSDGASRATALAFRGWAWRLAGRPDEMWSTWNEARQADADVPYAALFGALDHFARYVEAMRMPVVYAGTDGLAFGPLPTETEGQRELRARIEEQAGAVERACVWGKEGAEDVRAALGAMRAVHVGKLDAAEDGLSRALSSPDLRIFESGLLFARAHVRYLRMRFLEALEDARAVVDARPRWSKAHFHLAEVALAIARKETLEGKDPRPRMRESIAAYDRALDLEPDSLSALNNRGVAWQALGDAEIARGIDPRASYGAAIDDYNLMLRDAPSFLEGLANRGIAQTALGRALAVRGEDPRASYASAIDDASTVIEADPSHWMACNVRGGALVDLGEAELHRGLDPTERYRAAIADLERATRLRERCSEAWGNLGRAQLGLGDLDASRGKDPLGPYREALTAFTREIETGPTRAAGHGNRGTVSMRMAQVESSRGGDPSEWIQKAIADLDEAIRRDASCAGYRMNRGIAWQLRAEREESRGGDPSDACARSLEDLDAALAANPEDAMSYGNRARSHQTLARWRSLRSLDPREEFGRAIADYDQAVRRDSATPTIRSNRAQALVDLAQAEATWGGDAVARYREAIAECERGLEANREHAQFYAVRALAWYGLGAAEMAGGKDPSVSFEKAIQDLGEVISRNPSSAAIYNNRGGVRFYVAEWEASARQDPRETLERAKQDFDIALRLNPEYVEAWFNRGFARMQIGKASQARGEADADAWREALADFDAAISRNPSHWMAHANRGSVCEALGEWGEAEKAYLAVERLVGARPDVAEALERVRKAKGGGGK